MSLVQVYSKLYPGERAISPISIYAVLSALGYGASGMAEQQLLRFFGFNNRQQFLQLLGKINSVISGPGIKGGNAIFFDEQYSTINPEYYHSIAKHMFLARSDFSNSEQAAYEINKWIEINSGLSNVIPREVFNPSLKIIVANALWFKDEWINPFSEEDTHSDNFTQENGKIVQVQMMTQTDRLECYDQNGITAIKMSFKNGAYAEFIMGQLPEHLQYRQEKVELHLPRFTAEQDLNLNDLFKALGLDGLYNPGFLNISPRGDLFVSQARQKLYARFDEKGAEVKVVTYTGVAMMSMPSAPVRPKIIRFDRPFRYRIMKDDMEIIYGWYNGNHID